MFGTDEPDFVDDYQIVGLVLNSATPAKCVGSGIAWHYCFYPSQRNTSKSQVASFDVYREQVSFSSGWYGRIEQSIVRVEIRSNIERVSGKLYCEVVNIDTPFAVLEGDILGACLLQNPTVDALDIIGASDKYHLQLGPEACDSTVSQLVNRDWFRLSDSGIAMHLYLEMGKSYTDWTARVDS